MDEGEIATRIRAAIRSLILDQWELAALDVGERTVTSHLFRHLADQFEGTGFDVDHEYNRRYDLTKSLTFRTGDELGERPIFPDLIVHRRNRDGFNLVATKAKKGERTDSDDREKVYALLSQREYKYRCGVLLALDMTPPAGNGETPCCGAVPSVGASVGMAHVSMRHRREWRH